MKTFKRLRQEAMLTQGGLAAACGVSKQAVWEWEHAYARPNPENLKKLVVILGKEVSEILDALEATAEQYKERAAA
ncbi:MAG TPA: helix-turn-helix transcriptional regulator [Ktedonobacterales bacterium]|jgi:transcriptional regulator with XRE-family HTH domain